MTAAPTRRPPCYTISISSRQSSMIIPSGTRYASLKALTSSSERAASLPAFKTSDSADINLTKSIYAFLTSWVQIDEAPAPGRSDAIRKALTLPEKP